MAQNAMIMTNAVPRRSRWIGQVALLFVGIAMVLLLWQLWLVLRAVMLPSPTAFVQADSNNAEKLAQREASLEAAVKQLDGRSLFYTPSKPGEAGTAPVIEEEPAEQEAAPSRYEGPAITAIVLDQVWFEGGKKVKVGEGEVDDIEVIETDAPWGAKVKWKGKDFDVNFYERDRVVLKSK